MLKCLTWLVCTYLTLKFVQLAFGSRPGAWVAESPLRQRLLRGEPTLLAIAFALSVPTALLSSWYLHRGHTRSLEHTTDCYGRLRALDQLPAIRRQFDAYKVFQVAESSAQAATIAGQALDLQPARIALMLAQKQRFYTGHYAVLARQNGQKAQANEATAITRCLQEPLLNL
jgi:hypothetical protein